MLKYDINSSFEEGSKSITRLKQIILQDTLSSGAFKSDVKGTYLVD